MTPATARAIHRRVIDAGSIGRTVGFRRKQNGVVLGDVAGVKAHIRHGTPEELVAGLNQKARKVAVMAEDVEATGFPLPFKSGLDQVLFEDGSVITITDVDSVTHAGIAYVITAG